MPAPGVLAVQLRLILFIVCEGEVKLVGVDGGGLVAVQLGGGAGVVTEISTVSELWLPFLSAAATEYLYVVEGLTLESVNVIVPELVLATV